MSQPFVIYRNDRTYRSKSALEVVMKPTQPTLTADGRIESWIEGKIILSFYPRADMKAGIELDNRISLSMSFREMYKLIGHYSAGIDSGMPDAQFVHKFETDKGTVTKKLVAQWYAKDANSIPFYNLTAFQGNNRISVVVNYEEICIIKEMTSICFRDSHICKVSK